jgi:hypothetical protein
MTFHRIRSALLFVLVLATVSLSSGIVLGASSRSIAEPTAKQLADGDYPCTPALAGLLDDQRRRIADAPTVDDARELAVGPVRVARRALAVASFVAPGSDSLADATARLENFEGQVEKSRSPAEVAIYFTELVDPAAASVGEPIQLADLQVGDASVEGPGKCHYSTGEIVAIVIGFILFIIPGIILLIVLC